MIRLAAYKEGGSSHAYRFYRRRSRQATFHLVALGEQGKVVVRKKFSRKQLLAYTANLQTSLIGIEACSGAHFFVKNLLAVGRRTIHDGKFAPTNLTN